jgi:hypothetical protein
VLTPILAMESLAEHGICLPPQMQGLSDDQILELKLDDPWVRTCIPSGGARSNADPIGRRSGNGMPASCLKYTAFYARCYAAHACPR